MGGASAVWWHRLTQFFGFLRISFDRAGGRGEGIEEGEMRWRARHWSGIAIRIQCRFTNIVGLTGFSSSIGAVVSP